MARAKDRAGPPPSTLDAKVENLKALLAGLYLDVAMLNRAFGLPPEDASPAPPPPAPKSYTSFQI